MYHCIPYFKYKYLYQDESVQKMYRWVIKQFLSALETSPDLELKERRAFLDRQHGFMDKIVNLLKAVARESGSRVKKIDKLQVCCYFKSHKRDGIYSLSILVAHLLFFFLRHCESFLRRMPFDFYCIKIVTLVVFFIDIILILQLMGIFNNETLFRPYCKNHQKPFLLKSLKQSPFLWTPL